MSSNPLSARLCLESERCCCFRTVQDQRGSEQLTGDANAERGAVAADRGQCRAWRERRRRQWKRADALLAIALIPVGSPALLRGRAPPREASDVASLPLLHDGERQDWPLWFTAHGVKPLPVAAQSGPSFDDQMLLLRAAASGQGVALVSDALARPELARGTLVRAIALAWPQAFAYWVVSAESRANEPRISTFREWLLTEAHASSRKRRSVPAIAVGNRDSARYGRAALKRPGA